jgi:hypothetical protein
MFVTDGNSVAHDGNFFLNGYKEEYPNCINCMFPTFNSGKTIERQVERAFMNNIYIYIYIFFFDEVRIRFSGSGP